MPRPSEGQQDRSKAQCHPETIRFRPYVARRSRRCSSITLDALSVALHRVTRPQPVGGQDVALRLGLLVLHQGNVRTATRIVFDTQHLLLARLPSVEIHQPDPAPVSTTPTTHRHMTVVVASGRTALGDGERTYGTAGVKMLVERLPQPSDRTGDRFVGFELSILAHEWRGVVGRYTQSNRNGRFGDAAFGVLALLLDGGSAFFSGELCRC